MPDDFPAKSEQSGNGYKLPQKIGIVYSDAKRENFATEELYITEKEALHEAQVIAEYLEKMGITTDLIPANKSIWENLKAKKPDMVINLTGSVNGIDYLASAVPGILEILDIPYTGAGILCESLAYNKYLAKELMAQSGVPVPNFQLMTSTKDSLNPGIKYPVITKLNEVHGAVEIDDSSVCENEDELRKRLRFLINTYKQGVLVEEFIVGREFTAIVLEGLIRKVYLAEKVFDQKNGKYVFAKFSTQWVEGAPTFSYAKYEDPVLKGHILRAFTATDMYDYAKFDIRMNKEGQYFVIDGNSNPAFGPKELEIAIASILDLYGISFTETLKRLIVNTMKDSKGQERV